MSVTAYRLKRLTEEDDVQSFHCGTDKWEVDVADFLKEDALTQQQMGLNVTWLCLLDGKIVGYASLVASKVKLSNLFDWISTLRSGEIPIKQVPCMMIGRFAVDSNTQRQGVGTHMLSCARAIALKSGLGMRLATVDVDKLNDKGFQFWLSQGFIKVREGSDSRLMVYDLQGDPPIEEGD